MKLITQEINKENPSNRDIENAIMQAKIDSSEFILVEQDSKTAIQAIYLKDEKMLERLGYSLRGNYSGQWIIEKPESGAKKYYTIVSDEELQRIFISFLYGEDWKKIAKWTYFTKKERWIKISEEEKAAFIEEIDVQLDYYKTHPDQQNERMLLEWKNELMNKGALEEDWSTMLEIFLEPSDNPRLKGLYGRLIHI